MITKKDEEAYWRWMTNSDMTLIEAFALYRKDIENFYIETGAIDYGTYSSCSGYLSGK
jgi:hypothetical protein